MIQFDNVSKSFPSGSLFSGVTLSIKKGVRSRPGREKWIRKDNASKDDAWTR